MSRKSRGEANVGNIPIREVQRIGNPGKPGKHDGPAGSGEDRDLGNRKWNKEGRDNAKVEKEGGKSRGC